MGRGGDTGQGALFGGEEGGDEIWGEFARGDVGEGTGEGAGHFVEEPIANEGEAEPILGQKGALDGVEGTDWVFGGESRERGEIVGSE